MKIMIISQGHYDWIDYCIIPILENSNNVDLLILEKETDTSCSKFDNLCESALYYQRTYDLKNICRQLKILKASNMGFRKNYIEHERLLIHIELNILLAGTKEIYYPSYIKGLDFLLNAITKQLNIDIFGYGEDCKLPIKIFDLTDEQLEIKKNISLLANAIPDRCNLTIKEREIFY